MNKAKNKKLVKPTVTLSGTDGNAYAILGKVRKALTQAGYTDEQKEQYTKEAKAGDYDNLLQVTMQWVNVE